MLKDNGIIDRFDARENLRRVYSMDLPELAANFAPPPDLPQPVWTPAGLDPHYLMPEEDGTDG